MVARRAVSKADKDMQPDVLPTLYKTLIPLTKERHNGYYLSEDRKFDFASMINAIPLTVDEFPAALKSYPIVLAPGELPTPVALVGAQAGRNDCIQADGSWAEGQYIPAYVRRYPFAYVRESQESDRNILCADLSSIQFETTGTPERALFHDDEPGAILKNIMDFCTRYDQTVQRTRAAMEEAVRLDLVDNSTVTVSRGGKSIKVDGFKIISEEKLRNLPDDTLASLARRGVLSLYTAHHLSLTNFSTFGAP